MEKFIKESDYNKNVSDINLLSRKYPGIMVTVNRHSTDLCKLTFENDLSEIDKLLNDIQNFDIVFQSES